MGIMGFVGTATGSAVPVVERACQSVFHRGPHAGAARQDPDWQCVPENRQLAMLDLSPAAQPMRPAYASAVISHNVPPGPAVGAHGLMGLLRERVNRQPFRAAAALPREEVDAVARDMAGTRARSIWQSVWALAVLARWQ
jgi:hypothetical protein